MRMAPHDRVVLSMPTWGCMLEKPPGNQMYQGRTIAIAFRLRPRVTVEWVGLESSASLTSVLWMVTRNEDGKSRALMIASLNFANAF